MCQSVGLSCCGQGPLRQILSMQAIAGYVIVIQWRSATYTEDDGTYDPYALQSAANLGSGGETSFADCRALLQLFRAIA